MSDNCKARRFTDHMYCNRCHLTWDVDDDDIPECLTTDEIAERTLARMKKEFSDETPVQV